MGRRELADLLAELDRDDLVALMTRLLRERPELRDWVEAAIAAPATSGPGQKPRPAKVDAEAVRRQVIGILHSLDGMRASEAYGYVGGVAGQLRQVQETAIAFLDADDPDSALAILMVLAEEAGHGVENLDDSDGLLGDFMNGLGQPLAEAILSLDMSAVARARLAQRLEKEIEYLADYGMEEGLDLGLRAVTVYWDAEAASGEDWDVGAAGDVERLANPFGDLTEARLNVLKRQNRTGEYLALCQKMGRHLRYSLMLCDLGRVPEAVTYAEARLASAEDALQIAKRLHELGYLAESIALGERGLTLAGFKAHLGEWLGPIEEAQGRTQQAWQAWLTAFSGRPTLAIYETLKRLAGKVWVERQPQVMAMLTQSHDAMTLAQVLLSEQEWDEAIKIAERPATWYGVIETVVDAVIPYRPAWAARMSIQQAERLMVEAKSKHYPIAAEWLQRAKRAYAQMGQTHEWQAYLQKVKEQYKRRPALQAQLQRL